MKPIILAIDTATQACSVALQAADRVVSETEVGNNIHSQRLLPMIASVLEQADIRVADLNAVAVGQGPGSFTGLRIGIGVAQGIAYGAKCPMIGIASLAALAVQSKTAFPNALQALIGMDARMNEVYSALYDISGAFPALVGEVQVMAPEVLIEPTGEFVLAGNAWAEYNARLPQALADTELPTETCLLPDAEALLQIALHEYEMGNLIDPQRFEPDYVRNNVAKVKGE